MQLTPEQRLEQVKAVIALMEGGDSEHAACAATGINRGTFRSACLKMAVVDDYARAMAALAQDQTEKLEDAIRDMRDGTVDANMARVEIDARKWFASKFLPKRYGEKQQVEHSGQVGTAPDMQQIADGLVTQATANPTLNPVIRAWAEDLLARLPVIEA